MAPSDLVFHVEKLLNILFAIFSKTQDVDGSGYAFEAILLVIRFFKESEALRSQNIIEDYIAKRLQNQAESPVYPKILYQMLMFAQNLERSLKEGSPIGHVRQHFTLFKEMPTICSIIRQSFELEERKISTVRKVIEHRKDRSKTEA